MKWWYCSLICILFITACKKELDIELPQELNLTQIFDGRLSDAYIRALERMHEDLSYDQAQLVQLGETLEKCMLDLICINSNHSQSEIIDFKYSLRLETLPEMNIEVKSNEYWEVVHFADNAELIYHHKSLPLSIMVDLDDGLDDGKNVGIYPIINGNVYATQVAERTINLVRPTTDAGPIDLIRFNLESEKIIFRFEGGIYGKLNNSEDNESVFLQGDLQVIDGYLQMHLEGLYYILIPKGLTLVEYSNGSQTDSFIVTMDDEFTFYRENVRLVRVNNAFSSRLLLSTNVQRLQFDSRPGAPNFELDFDHSFKDRGQRSVATTLVIDELLQ